jgi:hypothetical protein
VISAEVIITGCHCCGIGGLGSGFVRANRTIERALDQTLRAESRGITRTQFGSALRTIWHLEKSPVPILVLHLEESLSAYFIPFCKLL